MPAFTAFTAFTVFAAFSTLATQAALAAPAAWSACAASTASTAFAVGVCCPSFGPLGAFRFLVYVLAAGPWSAGATFRWFRVHRRQAQG